MSMTSSTTKPTTASTATATATDTQTQTQTQTQAPSLPVVNRKTLLEQLAKQLTYYFSTQNLSKDVYLQTIMNLNSGHVPISILANFANVNKIIGRSGILLLNQNGGEEKAAANSNDNVVTKQSDASAGTGAGTTEGQESAAVAVTAASGSGEGQEEELEKNSNTAVVDDDTSSTAAAWNGNDYTSKIHELLRQAAHESNLLSVAMLNQDGNVIENEQQPETIAKDSKVRTFDAIGPSSLFHGTVSNDVTAGTGSLISISSSQDNITTTTTTQILAKTKDKDEMKNMTIIILRDVHVDATEEDVRQVFEQNHILNLQKEIGNCWFVNVDMENSPKDLVSTMLDLKNKTICNEPIKARVKTQTAAKSVSSIGLTSSISTVEDGKPNRNINNYRPNHYENHNHYSYNNRNGGGNGGGRNKTGGVADYNQYSNQIYSGDRPNFAPKKFQKGSYGNNNSGGSGVGGGSYKKQQNPYQQRDPSNNNSSADGNNKVKKVVVKSEPPPPVVEEHYPSLLDKGIGDFSPTSVADTGMGQQQQQQQLVHKSATAAVRSRSSGAYAAALLKQAPPLPSTSNTKPPTKAKPVPNLPSRPKGLNKKNENQKHENQVSFSSGKTLSTDDSSSDDKSSLSSKNESDSFAVGTASSGGAASNPVWGGGRSFADILKK